MFEIRVGGEFSAAHNLKGYQGKCEELHGHNWKVEVVIGGRNLDKTGMLIDFKQIKSRLNKVLDSLDHKHLNSLSYFKRINPSSENIAKFIYNNFRKQVSGLRSVTVWESDSCSATYYGG
jgi:6-pyruvoyltetrahydropterin/6-carboxytetrahydropterin synthase